MSNEDLPFFDELEERDKEVERLREGSVGTESIDLDDLSRPALTDSGSFDLRWIKQSAFGQLLGALPIPACLIDNSKKIALCSEAWGRITPSFVELEGLPFSSLCSARHEAAAADVLLDEVFRTRKATVREQELLVGENLMWARIYLRTIRFTGERMILCLIEDLTIERLKILLVKRLEQAKREWELTFDSVPHLMAIIDSSYRVIRANKAFIEALGSSYQEVLGTPCYLHFHGTNGPPDVCPRTKILDNSREYSVEYYSEKLGGHFEETLSPIVLGDREEANCVLVATDVSERKKLENKLYYRATHDALTGLFNWRQTLELLTVACESSIRYGYPLSLALCDLDNFKDINDLLGHQAGDKVLQRFGVMLKEEVRTADITGRYGGDEFIMAFPNTTAQEAALSLERLRSKMRKITFKIEGKVVSLSCSMGLAGFEGKTMTVKDLIKKADEALYAAKHNGRDSLVIRE